MKFGLLYIFLVLLGLVALSQSAPALEETNPLGGARDDSEGAMNEVADPNCGPKNGGASGADSEGMETQQQQRGSRGTGKKRGGGRKGGKGGRGGGQGGAGGGATQE